MAWWASLALLVLRSIVRVCVCITQHWWPTHTQLCHAAPTSAPILTNVVTLTNSSVHLSWDPPAEANGNILVSLCCCYCCYYCWIRFLSFVWLYKQRQFPHTYMGGNVSLWTNTVLCMLATLICLGLLASLEPVARFCCVENRDCVVCRVEPASLDGRRFGC